MKQFAQAFVIVLFTILVFRFAPLTHIVPESVQEAAVEKSAEPYAPQWILVTRVIDGDTIEIEGGDRVRYLGIDTPEAVDPRKPVQCFGKEAWDFDKQLVEGKRVRLVRDVEDRDEYNRLLRYVYLEPLISGGKEVFVNLELVRDGYARVYTYPPNVAHVKEFTAAAAEARAAHRGLWNSCE